MSPPPPIGTTTASSGMPSPRACAHHSAPSVAVPSAVRAPSNGCTNVRPSADSISRTAANAACTSSASTTSAPNASQRATRTGLAVRVMTTFAVVPTTRAAYATAIA